MEEVKGGFKGESSCEMMVEVGKGRGNEEEM